MRVDEAIYLLAEYGANINPNNPVAEAVKMGIEALEGLPSAQPEKTEYIPDTKALPSKRDCVDLAECVTATFYDQEHEEWTQRTVTIAEVLDRVCDEYTILPSAQPERKKGEWTIDEDCEGKSRTVTCNLCGYEEFNWNNPNFCPNCGADLRGEKE